MNWKKLFGVVLMLMLLAMGTSALADALTPVPVPAVQIDCVAPRGMEEHGALTINKQPGRLSIQIDDRKVDWAQAFASTGLNGAEAQIIWQLKVSADLQTKAKYVALSYDQNTLERAQRYEIKGYDSDVPCRFDQMGNLMPVTENGTRIAAAIQDESTEYVVPQNVSDVVYVRWYDQDNAPICTQSLSISITHTEKKAFTANVFIGAAKERIFPDTAAGVKTLEKRDGFVTYCVPTPEQDVTTRIEAPAGAAKYAVQGNMKDKGFPYTTDLPQDRCAQVTLRSPSFVVSSTQTIYFLKADGSLLETVTVNITFQQEEEMKVWPAYIDVGVSPLGKDQLEIINAASSMGYTCTYDESKGHLQCRFDGKQLSGAARQNLTTFNISAPEWGVKVESYRIYEMGSNSLLGASAGSLDKMGLMLDRVYPDGPEELKRNTLPPISYEPFRVIRPGADNLTLYVPDEAAMVKNYVKLYMVEWNFDDDSTEYQYFYMTTEPFTAATETYPVYAEGDLRGRVQHPCVVCGQRLTLVVKRYITQGDSTWHYDLTLVDDDGKVVKPNGPVKVYLPFPDGHVPGCHYTLHHYTDGLYNNTAPDRYQPVEIRDTEYGLMFETSSFSPFILTRQSGEAEAPSAETQPPRTGDSTPLVLWMGLAVLSAAAALLLMRKGKAA